jgi:predicted dehydrogenase
MENLQGELLPNLPKNMYLCRPETKTAMSDTKKIRFAAIGCGHIGKRHIEMILRNPDAELAAVCDILPKEELNLSFLPSFPCIFASSLDELLASADFDVLNICTPNCFHAEMAIKAMQTGHHCVIEKPMALNTADAQKIIDAANISGKKVFCVMQNRYSPPSVWIKNVVDSGILGKIFLVQINCFWNRDERYYKAGSWHGDLHSDGGTLFTQFSHFVDLMYWLFGDITNIRSRFMNFNHAKLTDFDDSGIVTFDFNNGGAGILNFSTSIYDCNFESSVTIIAENGTVKIGGQYMNEVEYCHIKDYLMPTLPPTNPGNDYGAYKGSAQNHHFVIENVVNVLKNRSASITTNVGDGYKVVDIIERIMKAQM